MSNNSKAPSGFAIWLGLAENSFQKQKTVRFGDASMVTAQLQDGSKIYSRRGVRLDDSAIGDGVRGVFDGVLTLANDAPDLLKTALAILDIDVDGEEVLRGEILTAGEDRRLMLAAATGDRCVDVPLDTDIFLVELVEGRLVSERGGYADLQPMMNIDVYGEMGSGGCFIAETIIADETDVTPPPAENRPPVADAGDDRDIQTGTGATLNGFIIRFVGETGARFELHAAQSDMLSLPDYHAGAPLR